MLSSKFSILSVEAVVKGRGEPKFPTLFSDFVTAANTPSLDMSVLKTVTLLYMPVFDYITNILKQNSVTLNVRFKKKKLHVFPFSPSNVQLQL